MQSFYTPATSTHISSHGPAAVDELINKYSSTMATATSPTSSYASGKTRRNIFQRTTDRVRLEYYRYEVTFGLYVMTPGEKLVANTFVLVVLSLLFWALLVYFPALLYQKLSRLVWLLTGQSGEEMGAALGILEAHSTSIPPFASEKALS
ncbi:serine palmitoyltransferase small subunit family protein [Aspergillus undulatus]|uniref:serine palmitoyltransferase small subunit family protein n=1 Tax=Aspergillus undulatus TaxID=1810928 RepID=UPI003CCD00EA